MKHAFSIALIVALLSIPAFAADNSQTVTFHDPVKVGSSQLPAGDYKISWTGTGSSVQVTISKKGVAPVTLPAKLVEQKHNRSGVTTNAVNGSNVLQTILLSHVSLIVGGPEAGGL